MYLNLTPKDIERFWKKVDRSGGPDSCWLWTAGCSGNGYGNFWVPDFGGPMNSHRVALVIATGGYDPALQALHECDNRKCCRVGPGHIYAGTPQQNALDWVDRGLRVPAHLHGSLNGMSKITEEDAQFIYDECLSGPKGTQSRMAERFGVSTSTVNFIVKGKTWPHLKRA